MRITQEMFDAALALEYHVATGTPWPRGTQDYLDRLPAATTVAISTFVYPDRNWSADNLDIIKEALVRMGKFGRFQFDD